jgi:hypothetical protein
MEWVGGEEDIFTFPDTFSLAERRQIHNICDQLKLVHKSTGEQGHVNKPTKMRAS